MFIHRQDGVKKMAKEYFIDKDLYYGAVISNGTHPPHRDENEQVITWREVSHDEYDNWVLDLRYEDGVWQQ